MSFLHRRALRKLNLAQTHDVSIRRDIEVRMPDGAQLLTDLYLGSLPARAPVILVRSPYSRSTFLAAMVAYPFAARGYNVVLQSCRGTFGSSGTFVPHRDEQRDGLATLEWIKQQDWYGGSIGTFGASYLGYVQWAIAAAAGPEVKAMAMQATASDFALMTFAGEGFALENALSWTHMMTLMRKRFVLLRFLLSRLRGAPIRPRQWRTLPLESLDTHVAGERVGFWQDWMQHHRARDPWWAPMSFRTSIGEIRRPITLAAGWFDIFLPWQLQDFMALRQAGTTARLTVGPWRHQDEGLGHSGVHEALAWFDRHLLGKDTGAQALPVKLYVIGADEWREFSDWPPREVHTEFWYLQPQRKLSTSTAPDSPPDEYRYDPADPTPSVGGPALDKVPFTVDNQALEARADVLTYTSDSLPQQRDLIGAVAAELFISSSAASADFFVRLCDVDANGVSRNVCDGLQRVNIAVPGQAQLVRVELWPTAYRFAPGHRIRVQISSGAFPRWSRNLGGAESPAAATQLHAAIQSIHHSPARDSLIELPFL